MNTTLLVIGWLAIIAISALALFWIGVNAWALFASVPARVTRAALHAEAILREPFHVVSRIWTHAKGIVREIAGE